ncbi:hypothetical protein [Shewanella waksmanii]|uniref:hypothetical protein n=1 Tax=Shewanella waksmanii TaxID=213783 RepID=UPI003736667A
MNHIKLLSLAVLLGLTGCGGGSDDGGNTDPITPPLPELGRCATQSELLTVETTSAVSFLVEPDYFQNQPASVIAQIPNVPSRELNFEWQQLAGEPLELNSVRSPVLNFEAMQSGSYQFQVNITSSNINHTENITVDINQPGSNVKVRADHQVVSGNGVSVRAAKVNNQLVENLSWCVAAGPNVGLDLTTPERPLFTAPNVDQDTLIILRATGDVQNVTQSDDVSILVTAQQSISSPYFDEPVARTFAYKADSPYASALEQCVYSNQLNQPCALNSLPLIGQQSQPADKQGILDRVLVSHQWMGENFERFLMELDPHDDFATLLQSVTAIVISYDIRPSFYWVLTGAIYLDPNDLWLTPYQRDTINEAPDYRAGFSNELGFLMPWRYVKDNQYVSYIDDISMRNSRDLQQLNADLASLLYHELAHANDFFPRSVHSSLSGPTLYDDYVRRNDNQLLVSDQLTAQYPLNSQELFDLADVRFRGESATEVQKAYTPSDISGFFSADRASDSYAYSTSREDAAMLLEEAMMSHRYGILRDVGVTDSPDNATSSNITVDWGQRGRIGQLILESRAALVINQMLPELNGQSVVQALPAPIPMIQGQSWADNLTLETTNNAVSAQPSAISRFNGVAPVETSVDRPLQLSGSRHR